MHVLSSFQRTDELPPSPRAAATSRFTSGYSGLLPSDRLGDRRQANLPRLLEPAQPVNPRRLPAQPLEPSRATPIRLQASAERRGASKLRSRCGRRWVETKKFASCSLNSCAGFGRLVSSEANRPLLTRPAHPFLGAEPAGHAQTANRIYAAGVSVSTSSLRGRRRTETPERSPGG